MKIIIRFATLLALGILVVLAQTQGGKAFRVNFFKTNVDEVLQALSQQTGSSIVYSGKGDIPITVNFLARNSEEAVRGTTSAASLVYRKVGNIFVVAAPENLRRALVPYGNRVKFTLVALTPENAARMVEASYPTVTAEPSDTKLAVTAIPSEIVMVREFLEEREREALKNRKIREVVSIRFASAASTATTIKTFYPTLVVEAVGKQDSSGGTLVLSGAREEVDAAIKLISSIDVGSPFGQDSEVLKIYEIRYSSAPELEKVLKSTSPEVQVTIGPGSYSPRTPGFRTITGARIGDSDNSGGGQGGGSGNVSGQSGGGNQANEPPAKEGDRAKTLILRGRSFHVEAAVKLLEQLDTKPMQVMVEVQVIDTSPELTDKLGIKWDWRPFNFWEMKPNTIVNNGSINTTRPAGFGQFTRLPWNFNALLDAMVVKKEAKILAKPSVMVVDGDESNVFIGDTIRARLSQSTGLGAQTVEIAEFPVGIILLLRPRVNADGNITMRVHPVVSTITAIDSDNVPQTSTREAETTVLIKDGETVVIGGLIRDEMTKTVQEIPILSRLPIVGELFRSRSTSSRKSEIIVLITPHLIKDPVPVKTEGKKG
jgi:type II secretory pathway component GspD/PulD (secretin)